MNIQDTTFLKALDNEKNKKYYARILILDDLDRTIKSIEGKIQQGSSININGNSSVRRTCNITLIADEDENDLKNLNDFLSINKKIKIVIGIEKNIDYSKDIYYYDDKDNPPDMNGFPLEGVKGKIYIDRRTMTYWIWTGKSYQSINSIYDYQYDLTWFPMGVYVITQPSITHSTSGCLISLSCKDKMCLLNGEMGGNLPTSVTFDEYNQIIGEKEVQTDPRKDSELEPNDYTVYKYKEGEEIKYYIWSREYGWEEGGSDKIGSTIHVKQKIYDIIQTAVINYGGESASRIIINDIPLEVKQAVRYTGNNPLYHNISTGVYTTTEPKASEAGKWQIFDFNEEVGYIYSDFTYPGSLVTNIGENVCSVLDKIKNTLGNYEYFYDIDGNFVFQEIKNYLNTSYDALENENQTQMYYLDNNKNFDIDNNSLCIIGQDNYRFDICGDQKSIYTFEEGTGLIASYVNTPNYANIKNDYHIWGKNNDGKVIHYHLAIKDKPIKMQTRKIVFTKEDNRYTGTIRLAKQIGVNENNNPIYEEGAINYTPNDWRAELYLQGLEIAQVGGRPDIYQQELLDLFDTIYEWGYYDDRDEWHSQGRFKTDITYYPNKLKYFIDYLEPIDRLYGCSIDDIHTKIYSYQQNNIVKLYDVNIPNYILINEDADINYKEQIQEKSDEAGQPCSTIDSDLYKKLDVKTIGYSAQETVRNLLYQYTTYNETISISCTPIYYLDVNRRITVRDKKSEINGDYIINSITLPLSPISTMNINASKALNRI